MEIYEMTVAELKDAIEKGQVSPREAWESYQRRIGEVEPSVKAYITICREMPSKESKRDYESVIEGVPPGFLEGVPFAVKDAICTRGVETTAGSKALKGYIPPYDATAVATLKWCGALLLGKTNMDEFAMGSSCERSAFFPTRNPWDLGRVPGGSSGGSAAAVAAGEAAFALGSDTGGSVRQPASLCGIVGLKPTYGRVSRYGLGAYASSLDQVGPMTRDVRDCALVLSAIAGHDPMDATSAPTRATDFAAFLGRGTEGLRLGLPREYMAGAEPAVAESLMNAVKLFSDIGCIVEECSLPHTEYGLAAYHILSAAEASSNLARIDGARYGYRWRPDDGEEALYEMYSLSRGRGFGPEVKRRILLGTYMLSSGRYEKYFLKAQKVRTLIRRELEEALGTYDVLISPTSPTVAFEVGSKLGDPVTMYASDTCTVPASLAGLPAISIPCGEHGGLPIGLQVIGRPFEEGTILALAYAFEQSGAYPRRMPKIPGNPMDGGRADASP